ncbi:MAG: hypothetical protein U0946_02105 [Patescibacteria group bacterium]|nr:hypothetical protein [Patescibacteria group bacterium]
MPLFTLEEGEVQLMEFLELVVLVEGEMVGRVGSLQLMLLFMVLVEAQ